MIKNVLLKELAGLEEQLSEMYDSVNSSRNLEHQVMKIQEKVEAIKDQVEDIEEVE